MKHSQLEKIFLKGWRPYGWIILIGFLVYFSTIFFSFTYLDDNALILDNYHFLKDFSNFFKAFKQDIFPLTAGADAYYRPILTVSFMIDAQLGGKAPFIYHFTNVLIHILVSCLVFLFLKKLIHKKELALFFASLFAVHPVLTQATAWIPGRNDSLMTLFLLAAFLFFLKFLKNKNWKNYFYHILFFALAFFTKEVSLFLVFICLAYLQFIKKEKLFSQNKLRLGIGWIGVIVFWFLMRSLAFINPLEMPFSVMIKSVWQNLPAAIQMFGKIIFPFNLSVLPIIQDTTFIYGAISLVILIFLLLFSKQKRLNYILFGAFWFLVFLLPSFIRPDTEIVADFIEHRLYLPMLGFFIIALEIDWIKNLDFKKKKVLIISGLVLILFASLAISHSFNFKNRLSFWKNAAENSPNSPLAHRNLGAMYYLDNNLDQAETEYRKSLKLNLNEEMVHNNLGLVYMGRGEFEKAEIELEKEIEINPTYSNAYYNLGLLYYRQEEFEEAEKLWIKTIEINQRYISAYSSLIVLYYNQERFNEANYYADKLQEMGIQVNSQFFKNN